MKLIVLLLTTIFPLIHGNTIVKVQEEVRVTDTKLRGTKVTVRKRMIRPGRTADALKPENIGQRNPLVDLQQHAVKLRGISPTTGKVREITVHFDKTNQKFARDTFIQHLDGDDDLGSSPDDPTTPKKNETEIARIRAARAARYTTDSSATDNVKPKVAKTYMRRKQPSDSEPAATTDGQFNQSLFEHLHAAPFEIYEEALGHELEEGESFPVFIVPSWHNATGVFSAFSKNATPLIFENSQVLLGWENIKAAGYVVSDMLNEFMESTKFSSSLIIGKSIGQPGIQTFLGQIVKYIQFGHEKTVLVPIAKISDFFDDTSEHYLFDPSTRHQEMAALDDFIANKEATTSIDHKILELREARMEDLNNLEETRFHHLFQILIRRSFLFAYGYADCLHESPFELRDCLDESFSNVLKVETGMRITLNEEISIQLREINHSFHSCISEACILEQNESGDRSFGSGSCNDLGDLRSYVHSTLQ